MEQSGLRQATAQVVSAFVGRNLVAVGDVPGLIGSVHGALAGLGTPQAPVAAPRPAPAVPISRSVQDAYIVCLEDGAKLKTLKRYLRARFGFSPAQYRERWGLPADYPLVAPAYSRSRSEMAVASGLGVAWRARNKKR